MIEHLEHTPDTTTEEFDQVWRDLDPETREVCPPFPDHRPHLTPLQIWEKKSKVAKGTNPSPGTA